MPPKQVNSPTQNELATLQHQFTMLMTRFEAQQLEIETLQRTSLQPRATPSTSPAPIEVIKEPAVSKPEPFTGTEDLSIFLQQCELSFDLQPSRFPTDFYRVGFILSYLQGPQHVGPAAIRWTATMNSGLVFPSSLPRSKKPLVTLLENSDLLPKSVP